MDASSPAGDDAAGANRRRSGRVVKKPELYIESLEATPSSTSKRKRTDQIAQDPDTEARDALNDSGDDDSEPDETDARAQKTKSRRPRKAPPNPARKKPKTNGQTTDLAIRPAFATERRPKKTVRILKGATEEEQSGIYGEIFVQGKDTQEVISEWLKRFDENEAIALAEIVNFVLLCAGCDSKVDDDDIQDPDNCTGKLTDLQDEYQARNVTEYPLIAARSRAVAVKNGLVDFFKTLVKIIAASGLLFDNPELMENIEVWISTMSSAANRPFRHTATVTSMAVISGLAEVGKEMMNNSSKMIRQSENERKKSRVNKSRVLDMDKKVKEASKKQESLDEMTKDWFDTVFVHRYRDVDSRIRSDCVEGLGECISTYPELFFDGQHLRYLGWVLSDAVASTRLEVVKQLQRLYSDSNKIGGLKTFTERFRPRLVEMATRDADMNVRVATIDLLDTLREAGLLEPDDIDAVGKLIFDVEARIRRAVVTFFVENVNDLYESKIEDLGGQEALDEALPQVDSDEDFETPVVEWLKLKCLAEMLESYDAESDSPMGQIEHGSRISNYIILASGWESRFSLAAQALAEHLPEIEDWIILAGYLLFDHSGTKRRSKKADTETQLKAESKLSEKQELILLEVLNAAVESSALSGAPSSGDRKGKKGRTDKKEFLEAQEEDARKLSIVVPRLLKKFGASPEATSVVLRLEHVLNLQVFQELRQDSTTYAELLDDINKQFLSHGSEAVIREASGALLHAKNYDELADITDGKLQALWDDTIGTFHGLNKGKDLSIRGNLSASATNLLANTTLRLANLASISSCVEPLETVPKTSGRSKSRNADSDTSISALIDLIGRGVPLQDEAADEAQENSIVNDACKSVLFYFMWQFTSLQTMIASSTLISSAFIDNLISLRDAAVANLTQVISQRHGPDDLRLQASGYLLDLYTLLATVRDLKRSETNRKASSEYSQLAQPIPPETQKLLEHVLSTTERSFAKKSRKNLEAADDDEPAGSDEEPESESEDEDAEEARLEIRQHSSLVAEQKLCEFASKLVLAIAARVLDSQGSTAPGSMAMRLQRNKLKLGQNFKDVVTFLESKKAGSKSKPKAKAKAAGSATNAKSAERVIDEDEDQDEDNAANDDDDNEEALRERGLVTDDGPEDEAMDDAGVEVDGEVESVLGD